MLSIAFVMAIVTSAIPKSTLFAIFSGLATGLSPARLDPFIHNMHVALWALAAVSLIGAGVCLLRPSQHAEADAVVEDEEVLAASPLAPVPSAIAELTPESTAAAAR